MGEALQKVCFQANMGLFSQVNAVKQGNLLSQLVESPEKDEHSTAELKTRVVELESELQASLDERANLQQQSQDQQILLERIAAFESEQKLLQKHGEENQRLKAQLYDLTLRNTALEKDAASLKALESERESLLERLNLLDKQLKSQEEKKQSSDSPSLLILQERIALLESESSDLRSQLHSAVPQADHQAALDDATTLREELAGLQSLQEDLEASLKTSEDSQQGLLKNLDEAAEQLDFSKRRQTELEAVAAEVPDLKAKLGAAAAESAAFQVELDDLKLNAPQDQTEQAELEALKQKIGALESFSGEAETLRSEREAQAKEIAVLSQELEDLQQRCMDLEDENEAHQSTVNTLNKTREELAARDSEALTLQEEKENAHAEISTLQEDVARLKAELDAATSATPSDPDAAQKLAELQTKFKKARVAHNNLSKQKKEALEKLEAVQKELEDLKSANLQASETAAEVVSLRAECETYSQRISDLEAQASEDRQQLADLESQLHTAQAAVRQSKEQSEELGNQLSQATSREAQLSSELSELGAKLQELEDQLEAQSSELADARALAESAALDRDTALRSADQANEQIATAEARY